MLSINIWELLWTVVNFFLLYFLLKKLLYEPLLTFMDRRRERMEAGLAAQRQVEERLAQKEQARQQEQERLRREAESRQEAQRAALDARRAEIDAELKQESLRLREEYRQKLQRLQEQVGERMAAQKTELAKLLVARLLNADGQQSL